ncbi:MAG TPA: acyltransferase [Acetobacteraceae bacterium]
MAARWSGRRERGSATLIRLMIWLSLTLGWSVGQALLYPITLYFVLVLRGARRASRGFLGRVLGRPATSVDVFRHFFAFSCVLLDRLFLLSNRLHRFDIEVTGLETIELALTRSRGCILLGSHLGSFEALRIVAQQSPVPVRILMYRGNARPYSRLVEALDPMLADSIIEIGEPDSMLRVHESVERGEIVGILADRAPRQHKTVTVPFLGEPADFPAGPLILAAALGTPVVLFFGIRTGNRRYEVHFEQFADRVTVDRSRRAEDLATWVRRYAARLETYARRYPFNWFNFYDFWENRTGGLRPAPARSAGVAGAAVSLEDIGDSGRGAAAHDRRVDAASGAGD